MSGDSNRHIRFWVLIIGVVLCILISWITPWNNIVRQNSPLGGGHFPLVSFFILMFCLLLWNPLAGRISPFLRLSLSEVLLLWAMSAIASTLSHTGFARTFIANITAPGWLQGQERQILKVISEVRREIFPVQEDLIGELLYGMEGAYGLNAFQIFSRIPWDHWITPLLFWGVFLVFLVTTLMGITGIFSHHWIENERMSFPLLRVPEIFVEESEKGSLWRNLFGPFFICGLLIPVTLHLLNGLHTYFPGVPQIPTLLLAQPYIPKEGLLQGFYRAKIYIYPAFIGFASLAPRQVSLSFWLFFVLTSLIPGVLGVFGMHIPDAALGTTFGPVLERVEEMQAVGAYGVFALFLIWLARHHIKAVFRVVARSGRGSDEVFPEGYSGFLSPLGSFMAATVGFIGLCLWFVCVGVDFLSSLVFLVVAFVIYLVSSRIVCQGGLPYYTLTAAPSDGLLSVLHSGHLSPLSIYLCAVVQKVAFLDMRESLQPTLFHASALSKGTSEKRRFLLGIVAATALSLVISTISVIIITYKYGILSFPDTWVLESVSRVHEKALTLIQHPEGPKRWSIFFGVVGAGVMMLVIAGYQRFIWWPLHPIGYLVAYSSAMKILWFSFFLGWLFNVIVMRYGGLQLYHKARWFFIGLIWGDVAMALLWLVIGLFVPISYHVFPL
ncbi:DUF6785 family protein [Thermodesulforhabdus norvegica]|uniref:Uncharacterized protein n=1 Tax=Thermodesulforhabdus norvegica TaxID=39841 RepID=A0A1I4T8Q3_9BACT|nr:DUF6785 family protein [Thermodesulforhabdus norvegica]SFM72947.1 hypothetical protein SAMN05660836_01284 [Thermodesulforhabdus norvegica]